MHSRGRRRRRRRRPPLLPPLHLDVVVSTAESGLGKFYFAEANSKAKMTKSRRKIAKLLPPNDRLAHPHDAMYRIQYATRHDRSDRPDDRRLLDSLHRGGWRRRKVRKVPEKVSAAK